MSRMRSARSSARSLSAEATEAWCFNNIAVSSSGIPPDRPVYAA